jgi:hypothetical protein
MDFPMIFAGPPLEFLPYWLGGVLLIALIRVILPEWLRPREGRNLKVAFLMLASGPPLGFLVAGAYIQIAGILPRDVMPAYGRGIILGLLFGVICVGSLGIWLLTRRAWARKIAASKHPLEEV